MVFVSIFIIFVYFPLIVILKSREILLLDIKIDLIESCETLHLFKLNKDVAFSEFIRMDDELSECINKY